MRAEREQARFIGVAGNKVDDPISEPEPRRDLDRGRWHRRAGPPAGSRSRVSRGSACATVAPTRSSMLWYRTTSGTAASSRRGATRAEGSFLDAGARSRTESCPVIPHRRILRVLRGISGPNSGTSTGATPAGRPVHARPLLQPGRVLDSDTDGSRERPLTGTAMVEQSISGWSAPAVRAPRRRTAVATTSPSSSSSTSFWPASIGVQLNKLSAAATPSPRAQRSSRSRRKRSTSSFRLPAGSPPTGPPLLSSSP